MGEILQKETALPNMVKNIDCREGLAGLPDNKVSLVLTDPPYFIDGMDDRWDDSRLRSRVKESGVIGSLPSGMKFDPSQSKKLREFLHPIAREWRRVTKPGGFVLCFMQPRLAHSAAIAMEDAGIEIRDSLVWHRNGQAKAFTQDHFIRKRRDLSESEKHQRIQKLNGRKTPQLRPENETIILGQVPKEGTFVDNWLQWGTGLIDTSNPILDPLMFPSTVMRARKPRERFGHMTAKPVDLLRHLVRIFSSDSEGSIVLDSFAGCGSTGEAAVREGRGFIGFEIDSVYTQTANSRIKRALEKLNEDSRGMGNKRESTETFSAMEFSG